MPNRYQKSFGYRSERFDEISIPQLLFQNIVVKLTILAKLELGEIEVKVLFNDVVEGADDAPLDDDIGERQRRYPSDGYARP